MDPLDGTREFAAGRDEFTVNIGLVRDGRPVLGAVGVPALGELFGGVIGPRPRAWKRTVAGEHDIRARTPPPDGLHVLASRSLANDPRLQAYLQGRAVAGVTNMGSALKIVRVAEGAADLYPRFGRTMEWDTAAPHAVLEAAGGTSAAPTAPRCCMASPAGRIRPSSARDDDLQRVRRTGAPAGPRRSRRSA